MNTYLSAEGLQARYGIGHATLSDWVRNADMPRSHDLEVGFRLKLSELEVWELHHQLWEKMGQAQKRFGRKKKNQEGKS